ncbi:C39 family peptidase [Emergencia timonensis]|uniref:C39 family peptidase n=1 Tax=Emergencia timonensis TaxID=1776384 RepID=UPI00399612A7
MKRKKEKAVLFSSFLLLAFIGNFGLAFASTEGQLQKQLKQDPNFYSEENLKGVETLQQNVDNYLQANPTATTSGGRKLNVTMYQQDNDYYCGPACVQMVTYYGGFRLYKQSTLANYMGTNRADGTIVANMTKGINKYWTAGNYRHVTTSQKAFSSGLVYSIDKGRPVVCHVMTRALPLYDENHNYGHYVVATGYDSGLKRVYYADPNWRSEFYGAHYSTWAAMNIAINNNAGYYIMAE